NLSSLQLGVRYILPALPLLVLIAGQTGRWIGRADDRGRSRIIVALAALTLASARFHPHHIAYFNELAGGPDGGRNHLVDSNLDWGQDLNGLRDWIDRNRVGEIGLAYFGSVPPAALGIRYHLPPSW